MTDTVATVEFKARHYQLPVIRDFKRGIKHHYHVWHRRAGKDRVATFVESMLAATRPGLYWHALPEYRHARRVIWDNITRDGERLIDIMFPADMIAKRNDQDMKLELHTGSIWQLVGADNFDSLVGSNPVHVTFSEFALMHPNAREFVRPILAENNGTELLITTPRGYNHAHKLWQYATTSKAWATSLLTVDDTKVIDAAELAEQQRTMPDELFRQEYYCDWSAANVGSILGRYVEEAERANRIGVVPYDPTGALVEVSCDIGFRDTAAFWFWQPTPDGFKLIDFVSDSGLDAPEWITRLRAEYDYPLGTFWMPHDAKSKTFLTKRSAMEQFGAAGFKVKLVPNLSKSDRINAARMIMPRCFIDSERCAVGLEALRAWSFEYNEETRTFSREPKHDWASHAGDGFSYGAVVMQERRLPAETPRLPLRGPQTIGEMIQHAERAQGARRRV